MKTLNHWLQHHNIPENLSQSQSSEPQTISIDELSMLDIRLDNQLDLLAIRDDESELSSILNVDKTKMIYNIFSHGISIALWILPQRINECSTYCNHSHLLSILKPPFFLQKFQLRTRQKQLLSIPHNSVSNTIISVTTTRHVKLFVMVTYISVKLIAFSALGQGKNYLWRWNQSVSLIYSCNQIDWDWTMINEQR